MTEIDSRERVAIRPGLLGGDLDDLAAVRLVGSRCGNCAEVALGSRDLCPNCGSGDVADVLLANEGELWTFTVSRHRPPGAYRGPDPFVPFGVGLVELADGIRVMTPLHGDVDELRIGMPVRLVPVVHQDEDRDVVAFAFGSTEKDGSHV